MTTKPKIAAILTEYRPNSHADVIVTKLLQGIPTDRELREPRVEIVSMYVDQFADNDLSRDLSAKHDVPIFPSIVSALTLGGDSLAVDGVLLIGEHGDYAWNEKDQQLYPRKYFMEQICGVFATSGRAVPVFNDKHLSYNWHDARWMVDRAAQLGAPFMAGSTVPLGWRSPWLEHELGTELTEAVALGFSGLDVYGFHTLEGLQCMVERRKGGETGVAAVTCLEGDAIWAAADAGAWWLDLADAACAATPAGAEFDGAETEDGKRLRALFTKPALFLLEYRDGFRGAILMEQDKQGSFRTFGYAARVDDAIQATEIHLQGGANHAHFSYLSLNIEEMFLSGKPTYPVERTLLTTGVLEAALDSRYQGHVRLETPHLDVAYTPVDRVPWRAEGPRPSGPTLETVQ